MSSHSRKPTRKNKIKNLNKKLNETLDSSRIVVTQQPGHEWEFENEWKHTLFDCCQDSKICFCAFCCPGCFFCELFSRTGECLCTPIFAPFSLFALRTKLRTGFRIKGSTLRDCLVTCFCPVCAAIQMNSELNEQGL